MSLELVFQDPKLDEGGIVGIVSYYDPWVMGGVNSEVCTYCSTSMSLQYRAVFYQKMLILSWCLVPSTGQLIQHVLVMEQIFYVLSGLYILSHIIHLGTNSGRIAKAL